MKRLFLTVLFLCALITLFSESLLDLFKQWKYNGKYNINKLIRKDWGLHQFLKPVSTPNLNQNKIYLLIIIHSAPGNFENRDAIRRTWANSTLWNGDNYMKFKVVFIVAKSNLVTEIQTEQEQYNDLVVGSFEDSYTNLVYKTLFGLSWAMTTVKFEFLFKTDDDVYLNVACLLRRIEREKYQFPKQLYAGYILRGIKPDRRPWSKWKIDEQEYPSRYLPPYASGSGVLFSLSSVKTLLKSAEHVKPIPIEDVYTGLLMHYSGIKLYDFSDSSLFVNPQEIIGYSECQLSNFCVFVHSFDVKYMNQMHFKIVRLEISRLSSYLCFDTKNNQVYLLVGMIVLLLLLVYRRYTN